MNNLGSPSLRHLSTSLMDFSQASGKQAAGTEQQSDKPRYAGLTNQISKGTMYILAKYGRFLFSTSKPHFLKKHQGYSSRFFQKWGF